MIKFFFIILIIFSGCSLEKKTFFKGKTTSENKEIDIKKKKIIKKLYKKILTKMLKLIYQK